MPEPVFFVRGIGSPSIDTLVADSAALTDLKAAAGLADELVDAVRQKLSEVPGFLDRKSLELSIKDVIRDDSAARSVHRLLCNLAPDVVGRLLDALAERRLEKEDFPLDDDVLKRLRQVLPKMIQPYPAIVRFQKAERLAKLTGQELESIELICDLRPIFDEDRKQIEGMMPYTRLHIVATGADGLPKSFEAELTHQQVIDLREKAAKAESKLAVLGKSIEVWLPGRLPDLPLTRVTRKESSDA